LASTPFYRPVPEELKSASSIDVKRQASWTNWLTLRWLVDSRLPIEALEIEGMPLSHLPPRRERQPAHPANRQRSSLRLTAKFSLVIIPIDDK